MNESVLPALRDFLAGAPALSDLTLRVEDAGPAPGTGGLWPRGVTVLTPQGKPAGGRQPALPGGIFAAPLPAAAPGG